MSDYKDNALVVQSNQFVRGSYNNLKANEIKMFDIFVSCIDTMRPKNVVKITKSELLKAMGDNGTNYANTKETLMSLFNKYWLETTEKSTIGHHFINKFEWFHDLDEITIEFHEDIVPMLIDLKTKFLVYSVADLNCLHSRYSMLLYKYILSYIRQYKTTEFILTIEELRKFLNLDEKNKQKYKRFEAFERKILKVFETEVNSSKYLPYLVKYVKLTNGRKVKAIKFFVRARTSNSENTFWDIDKPIMYEERTSELLKDGKPLEEIRNRQADAILSNSNVNEVKL